MLDLQRVYAYLAWGRWFRRTGALGVFSLGSYRYGLGKAFANQTLEITFNPQTLAPDCLPQDGLPAVCVPTQGLTKSALVGALDPLLACPEYQLALPFSPAAWREMAPAGILTGTT